MAHYAFIKNNIVTEVIVGIDENDTSDLPNGFTTWEEYYLTQRPNQDSCKRTSYNTIANTHTDSGTPFRGNFAGIGYTYDATNDVFYEQQPFNSWTLNSNWVWEAPLDYPNDDNIYIWDEELYQSDNTQGWVVS